MSSRYRSGVGAGSGSIDAATPPADTSDSKAAGVGLAAKTFGAFTGDGAADIASYTVTNVQAAGSCTWSGSGLGPYTPSDSDGDSGTLYLDAWDGAGGTGNRLGRAVHSYDRASPAGGAAWSTVWELDLSDGDVTDLTLTKGGGDTNLRNAADDTTRAVVGFTNRNASPSGSCVISTAEAGARLTTGTGGTDPSHFFYVKIDEASTGIDLDDGHLYAIDVIIEDVTHGGNTTYVLTAVGNNAGGINSGYNLAHRWQRVSASSFTHAARTYRGGSADVGSTLTSDGSQTASVAMRWILDRGGDLMEVYFQKSAAYLTAGSPRPTTGASLWNGVGGTAVIATGDKNRMNGAPLYVLFDMQAYGGTSDGLLTKVRIQKWS